VVVRKMEWRLSRIGWVEWVGGGEWGLGGGGGGGGGGGENESHFREIS